MSLGFSVAVRAALGTALFDKINTGAGPATINIYQDDVARPSLPTDATAATILAQLSLDDPPFTDGLDGVLTLPATISDVSADATGTAAWFRMFDGDGLALIDGDVGTSGSDLNLNSTTVTATFAVDITSMVLTVGNE